MKTPPELAVVVALAGVVLVAAHAPTQVVAPPTRDGEAVARRECSSCHAFPEPEVLPRRQWGSIAYEMAGLIMGRVGAPRGGPPLSADFDVDRVIRYYESRAPRVLPAPAPWPDPGRDPERFERRGFAAPAGVGAVPWVANVRFQRSSPKGPFEIVAADMASGLILRGDPGAPGGSLGVLGRIPNPCHTEAADLDRDGRMDLVVADLGGRLPEDHALGSVVWLQGQAGGGYRPVSLAKDLPRVADVQPVDVDGDGDLDLIVAAFGWRTSGAVFILENRTVDYRSPHFVRREVDGRSGSIHVPVADLDGDGRPDFVALFAQHHEAVVAFLNQGQGGFRAETVDQAPHPAWGSSGMELVDLDGDRDLDVLVTNGDMLDDFLLKPYHGIRWLENRGRFPFVPHEIANLPGVHRARAADLDGDGDLDVVACAFVALNADGAPMTATTAYPSLVWLEQRAPGTFVRHTLERSGGGGHVSLDVADFDGDGDVDVVVGNFRSVTRTWVELWVNEPVRR